MFFSVSGFSARHGLLDAVRNVSFTMERGEILAIVGANGAGKTTLLRALAGAHAGCTGEVVLDGRSLSGLPSHKRVQAGLALVPEGRRLFPAMTVEENIRTGLTVRRNGPWTPEAIFELFPNLKARRHARAGHLSGGEQQATAIGRALVANPDLLIMDEVSLGLSPAIVDRVYEMLPRLTGAGTAILLVEQDLTRVLATAGRIICMLEGRFVLDRPRSEVTREAIIQAYFGLPASGESAA